MRLAESTIKDLKRAASEIAKEIKGVEKEIITLREKQSKLMQEYRGIQSLLGKDTPPNYRFKRPSSRLRRVRSNQASGQLVEEKGFSVSSDRPIRELVLKALEYVGEPIRPAEIAKLLKKAGLEYDQKTPLATRVANELHRLYKQKRVEREAGMYMLPRSTKAAQK